MRENCICENVTKKVNCSLEVRSTEQKDTVRDFPCVLEQGSVVAKKRQIVDFLFSIILAAAQPHDVGASKPFAYELQL